MTIPNLATVADAKAALAKDKLASVYYRSDKVFVATAFGTGTFSWSEWRQGGGPMPSIGR